MIQVPIVTTKPNFTSLQDIWRLQTTLLYGEHIVRYFCESVMGTLWAHTSSNV